MDPSTPLDDDRDLRALGDKGNPGSWRWGRVVVKGKGGGGEGDSCGVSHVGRRIELVAVAHEGGGGEGLTVIGCYSRGGRRETFEGLTTLA